jgi:hypothetical protein
MLFAAVTAVLYVGLFAAEAIDPALTDGLFPIAAAALILAVLAFPSTRRASLDVMMRYALALAVYAAFVALMFWDARAQGGARHALGLAATSDEVFQRIGFAFSTLAVAGVSLAKSRRVMLGALLSGVIALALLATAPRLLGGANAFAPPPAAGCVFAALAALAAFAVADAFGRQPAEDGRRRSRAERLLLPAAGLTAGIAGIALTGTLQIAGGFAIGLALLATVLTVRERKGRLRPHYALLTAAAFAAGAALLYAAQRTAGGALPPPLDFADPMTRRLIGAFVIAAVFIARLLFSNDRGRRPSRGAGLALACLAIFVLAGPAVREPAALAALALALGVAAAYADRLAALNPDARSAGQT